MKDFVIEKEFEHKGLKCVVLFGYLGYRTGYVGVPKEHPDYGKDYEDDDLCLLNVHGGLTYSGHSNVYPIESDNLHWFGFDCAHLGDGVDLDLAVKTFPERLKQIHVLKALIHEPNVARSLKYVENECKKLSDQLSGRSVD